MKKQKLEENEEVSSSASSTTVPPQTSTDEEKEAKKEVKSSSVQSVRKKGQVMRSIDYVLIGYKQHANPYIGGWVENGVVDWMLNDPNCEKLNNYKQLSKEMCESWAVYEQIKPLLKMRTDLGLEHKPVVIVDVCSGKGFTDVLLSRLHPEFKIHMVDKDKKMKNHHLKSLSNVTFHNYALFIGPSRLIPKDKSKHIPFSTWLRENCDVSSDNFVIMTGVHLCGRLSSAFITAFNECPEVFGMILSPCCLPRQRKKDPTVPEYMDGLDPNDKSIDKEVVWEDFLYRMIDPSAKKERLTDALMKSKRNRTILATRVGGAGSGEAADVADAVEKKEELETAPVADNVAEE